MENGMINALIGDLFFSRGFGMSVFSKKDEGVSLIAVLIVVAIGGIMAVIFSRFSKNSLDTIKKQQTISSLEDLRQFVRFGMVCPASGSAWVVNQEIAVPRKGASSSLIKIGTAGYTRVGPHCLRAVVTSAAPMKEMSIQYSEDCSAWKALFDLNTQCP
jgi:Tfp pilus assembly protein PilE